MVNIEDMKRYPSDDYELEELGRSNAQDWQIDALKMNPEYVW